MSKSYEKLYFILAECPENMAAFRGVTYNKVTNYVTYTPAGEVPDGITITKYRRRDLNDNSEEFTIEFIPIKYILGSRFVELAGNVSKGDALEVVGTEGKFQKLASGLASGLYAVTTSLSGELVGAMNLDGVAGINNFDQVNIGGFKIVSDGVKEITLSTSTATTSTGITVAKTFAGLKSIVSEAITGLDSADHHYQVGVSGTTDKYIDKANGAAATSIAKNTKAVYDFDPDIGKESAELIITITGGSDQTPDAGKIKLEVLYFETENLPDEA